MANPTTSPWLKRYKYPKINDLDLYFRWAAIEKHLTTVPTIQEHLGILKVNDNIYICKNKAKMRLRSHLDWVYYTPKTLAQAIDNDTVEEYYEIMLKDVRSDPNLWKDTDFELELKSYYAVRVGRASLI
jgi:hypothetical protein